MLVALIMLLAFSMVQLSRANENVTWRSIKWDTVCPRKHFGAFSSCFAYFLLQRTYVQSEVICMSFSNSLVSLERVELWNELIGQLVELELNDHKFRIGLRRRRKFANKEWEILLLLIFEIFCCLSRFLFFLFLFNKLTSSSI